MIQHMAHSILHGLGGIQQYGIVSLCLFCLVFTGAILWALFQNKRHLDYMARIALDDSPPGSHSSYSSHPSHPQPPTPHDHRL